MRGEFDRVAADAFYLCVFSKVLHTGSDAGGGEGVIKRRKRQKTIY